MTEFLRPADLVKKAGKARSQIYRDITSGLLPQPIKIGVRASAFPVDEVETVFAARAAGANDDQLKALVKRLHTARAEHLATILQGAAK